MHRLLLLLLLPCLCFAQTTPELLLPPQAVYQHLRPGMTLNDVKGLLGPNAQPLHITKTYAWESGPLHRLVIRNNKALAYQYKLLTAHTETHIAFNQLVQNGKLNLAAANKLFGQGNLVEKDHAYALSPQLIAHVITDAQDNVLRVGCEGRACPADAVKAPSQ